MNLTTNNPNNPMNTSLIEIVEQSGLEKTQAQTILDKFTEFFDKAKVWEAKARKIVVTEETQVSVMKEAREARLALKEIRVEAEKVRKELKERSVREGKAIDGIANVIKALVVPIEEYLEKQEKFAEFKATERKESVNAERISQLQQYVPDTNMYNLKDMSEEGFQGLLKSSMFAFNTHKEAEAQAEVARVAKAQADAIENERIRQQNAELRAAADAKEKETQKERAEQQQKLDAEKAIAKKAQDELEQKLDAMKKKINLSPEFIKQLKVLLEFAERWNKQDKEVEVAEAISYLENSL